MGSCEKMQCTLQKAGSSSHTTIILRLAHYPKELVQTMINYLYTGIMEKPQYSECELFEQLLAEYDLMPNYTLNPKDLEIIGKVHKMKEAEQMKSTLHQNIKPEVIDTIETKNYNSMEDYPNDANKGIIGVKIKQEMDYSIELNCANEVNDGNHAGTADQAMEYDKHELITDVDHNEHLDRDGTVDDTFKKRKKRQDWSMICVPKMGPTKRKFLSNGPKVISANKRQLSGTKSKYQIMPGFHKKVDTQIKSEPLDPDENIEINKNVETTETFNANICEDIDDGLGDPKTLKDIMRDSMGDEYVLGMEWGFTRWRKHHSCDDCKDGFADFKKLIQHYHEWKRYEIILNDQGMEGHFQIIHPWPTWEYIFIFKH